VAKWQMTESLLIIVAPVDLSSIPGPWLEGAVAEELVVYRKSTRDGETAGRVY